MTDPECSDRVIQEHQEIPGKPKCKKASNYKDFDQTTDFKMDNDVSDPANHEVSADQLQKDDLIAEEGEDNFTMRTTKVPTPQNH